MKRNAYIAATFPLLLTLVLSACASPDGEFPSLLRRPYESKAPIADPVAPSIPAPVSLSAELSSRVAILSARHRAAASDYAGLLPTVTAAARAATGSNVGSEAWVNGHLQVSRLDKARADCKAVLSDMDRILTTQLDTETKGMSPEYSPQIANIHAGWLAAANAQDEEIERLSALIGL
jgi:hypothetical protein